MKSRASLRLTLGVHWLRRLGETADFSRRDGGEVEDIALVFGVRLWF